MRKKGLYQVVTGLFHKDGYDKGFDGWNVIADDAEEAVKKTRDLWKEGEVLESVSFVCVIDIE